MFIRMFKLVKKHSDSRLDAVAFVVIVALMLMSCVLQQCAEIQRLLQ